MENIPFTTATAQFLGKRHAQSMILGIICLIGILALTYSVVTLNKRVDQLERGELGPVTGVKQTKN